VVPPLERSLYQVLGAAPEASDAQLRQSYLSLARRLHPDRYVSASPAERSLADRRMREVNAAWEVLGRSDRRAAYDLETRVTSRSPSPTSGPTARIEHVEWETDDLDDDDVELSRHHAFLLRRGPVIVAVAIALALFVGTAYASSKPSTSLDPTPTSSCNSALRGGCDTQGGG
jgi:curved DNA-binding protein CbpA